jgi:hypothetical protein
MDHSTALAASIAKSPAPKVTRANSSRRRIPSDRCLTVDSNGRLARRSSIWLGGVCVIGGPFRLPTFADASALTFVAHYEFQIQCG